MWKSPSEPAVIDSSDVATVEIVPAVPILGVKRWGIDSNGDASDVSISPSSPIQIEVGPGEAVYIELMTPEKGDFNLDGKVDFNDYSHLAKAWQSNVGDLEWNEEYNLNSQDEVIDISDLMVFVDAWLTVNIL